MSEELLPCPFCGGESKIIVCDREGNLHDEGYERNPWSGLCYLIFHKSEDCPVGHSYPDDVRCMYDTEAETIEAWNTRSERTCRYEHIEGTWYKTSCGERYDGVVPPNYCPNCGAKVVS